VSTKIYSDLTGDGIEDAIIGVPHGNSFLSYYVYTYENDQLVKLFEKEMVYQAQVDLGHGTGSLVESAAIAEEDKPAYCLDNLKVTTYTWNPQEKTFTATGELSDKKRVAPDCYDR
jgi:hypothetical protein